MNFELSDDTLMLRDMLRRFVQKEARPLEMDYFNSGVLKPEVRARLRKSIEQLGLWGIMTPEEFGGGGLDAVTACVIEEELGGTFIPLELGGVTPLLFACQDDQVRRYLEPALEGSRKAVIAAREQGPDGVRPEAWTTTASLAENAWLLNGQKILTARPGTDDFVILLAKVSSQAEDQGGRETAFLLELNTPGLSITENGVVSLNLDKCQVGQQNLLGEVGGALKIQTDEAQRAWIRMGARYVGIVERLIVMAAEHARDWVSLGAALAVRPAIQRMIAEMRVEVESVRWLVYHAAYLVDTKKTAEIKLSAAQVRLASGEMLKHAVDRTTMIFAGPGPVPQIELHRIIQSTVPMEALELALENARAVIANHELNLSQL